MSNGSDGGQVRSDGRSGTLADTRQQDLSASSDDVLAYNTVVSFYRHLHRRVPNRYRLVAFGGSGIVGAGVFFFQLYAHVAGAIGGVGASLRAAVVGFSLFSFGVGYYATHLRSSCSECETPFSRRRTEIRQVQRRSRLDATDHVYLESTFECQACEERTTEANSYSEHTHSRF